MGNIKEQIIEIAERIHIDCIGFTSIDSFEHVRSILVEREKKGYLSGFEEKDMEKRINPLQSLEGARSIISIGISYHNEMDKPTHDQPYGQIAKSSWGRDYHRVVQEKMEELMAYISREITPVHYEAFVDTGPLLDRAIAHRAGLGSYGKNGFIIHPVYGSWIFLGSILVDIKIEEDKPVQGDICGTCEVCIKACPAGALESPYVFNAKKCISYLTQKKEIVKEEEGKLLGNTIYGCDICQQVCPQNKGVRKSRQESLQPLPYLAFPTLEKIIRMSNQEFKDEFKPMAAGWRGKKVLQRNAIIALGNSKDKRVIPILKDCLQDSRWDIRYYSVGALAKFGEEGKEIIRNYAHNEVHPDVKNEINNYVG